MPQEWGPAHIRRRLSTRNFPSRGSETPALRMGTSNARPGWNRVCSSLSEIGTKGSYQGEVAVLSAGESSPNSPG